MAAQLWGLLCELVGRLTAPSSSYELRAEAAAQLLATYEDPAAAPLLCAEVLPHVIACSCARADAGAAPAHAAVDGMHEASLFFAVKALRAAASSPVRQLPAELVDVLLQLSLRSQCACVTPIVRTQCHLGIADAAKMSVAQSSDGQSELSDYVFQLLAEACNSADASDVATAFAALTALITEMVQTDSRLTFQQQQLVAQYRASRLSQLCSLCVGVSEAIISGFGTGQYTLDQQRHLLLGCVQTLRAFTSDASNYDLLTEKFFEALFAAVEVTVSCIHSGTADSIVDVCDSVCGAVCDVIKRRYVPAGEAGVWFMTTLAQRTLAILSRLQHISGELPPELSMRFIEVVEQFVRIHLARFIAISAEAQQFLYDVCTVISDISKFSHDSTLMSCVADVWVAILDVEEPVFQLLEQQPQLLSAAAHNFLSAAVFARNADMLESLLDDEDQSMNAYDSTNFLAAIVADESSPDSNAQSSGTPTTIDAAAPRKKPPLATALTTTESEDLGGSPLAEFYSCVRNVLFRMCQFPSVQHALAQAIQSALPASLGSIDGDMSADERAAHVLDVCFLMSLLPVASGSPEAMYENLLGILSTVKHIVVQRLFSSAPAFGFLACCAVDIVIPVLASLSSHFTSWDAARLESLLAHVADAASVALDFFMMPPPMGIASSGAQLLHACCRYLPPQSLQGNAGMVSVLENARRCLGNSSIPASLQSGLLLALLELAVRSPDQSTQAIYADLLNQYALGIDAMRSQQSPSVMFGASIAAECLAVVLSERYRFSIKEERSLIFGTLAPVLNSSSMQQYFIICYANANQHARMQAAAAAQALLNLLYVAVRNYGKHLDNLLVVDVVGRSFEYVSHAYHHKAHNGLTSESKDLSILRSAMKLLQQACVLGVNADANLEAAARAVAVVKELSALFEDASQVMSDLLLPAVELLSTAINRLWQQLAGTEGSFAVQAGLMELCTYALATDSIPPECTQTCVLHLVELDRQRGFLYQPWIVENYWQELSQRAAQAFFSNSGAAALYGDDISMLLYRLSRVDLPRFMQSVLSPALTAVLAAKPEAGLDSRRQFIYEQAIAHWSEVVDAAEKDIPEQLFLQAATRSKHDVSVFWRSQSGLAPGVGTD